MGQKNGNYTRYQFWQQNNRPIELEGSWLDQKLEYMHQNPVEAGWVNESCQYFYSSARNYAGLDNSLLITPLYYGVEI